MKKRTAPLQKHNAYTHAQNILRPAFLAVFVFSAIINILMLTGSIYMLQVYDRVLSSGSLATLITLFGIVLVLYVFLGFYDFLRRRMLSRIAIKLDQDIGSETFNHWVYSGIRGGKFDQTVEQAQPMRHFDTVRHFLSGPAVTALFDLPFVPLFLVMLFMIHPWLGILTVVGALVAAVLATASRFLTRDAIRNSMMLNREAKNFSDQAHFNGDVIVAMGMQHNVATHWRVLQNSALIAEQNSSDPSEVLSSTSKSFRMVLQSSILTLGAYLVLAGEISAGMIIASSILSGRALAPIDQTIGQWRSIGSTLEAHRLLTKFFATRVIAPETIDLPAPTGAITIRDLSKLAPQTGPEASRKRILRQVSFELEPGDGLGVIGNSASGKSTLAKLLVGIWRSDGGEIRLDSALHEQWDPTSLGRWIGYLPQNFSLLPGTIAANIARFEPDVKDSDVIAAAKMAGVHEMILRLPKGYTTQVGMGTEVAQLSGGQVQRLGLARAIFGTPKFVVLDEPNSNLDVAGDNALTQAIAALREAGSTVIVMAHRPSAIATVNKVLVLNNGQVAHFGNKEDVLSTAAKSHERTKKAPDAPASNTPYSGPSRQVG
jgi:PrtD family type I secretion system ABC transporter